MEMRSKRAVRSVMLSVGVVAVATTGAFAQTWTGGGGDNNWSTSGNWSGGVPSSNGTANVVLAGSTRTSPVLETSYSLNALTFSSASSFTLNQNSGGTSALFLAGGLGVSGTGFAQVNAPLTLTGSQGINVTNGNLNILKGMTVNSGVNASVTIGSTKTLQLVGPLSLFSNASLALNGPGNATVSASGGAVFGSATVTANGGIVTFAGTQVFNQVNVGTQGTIRINASNVVHNSLVSQGGTIYSAVSQSMGTVDLSGGTITAASNTIQVDLLYADYSGSGTNVINGSVNAGYLGIFGESANNGVMFLGGATSYSRMRNSNTIVMLSSTPYVNEVNATLDNEFGFTGTLDNLGTYVHGYFGSFAGTYIHDGGTLDMSQTNGFTVSGGGIILDSPLALPTGGYFGAADATSTLVNNSTLYTSTALIYLGGGMTNNRLVYGGGELQDGVATNLSTWNVTSDLILNIATFQNSGGTLNVPGNCAVELDGNSVVANAGTINLSGGQFTGGFGSVGTVSNSSTGQIIGFGVISTYLSQKGLLIPAGGTLNVTRPFTNQGIIRAQAGGMLSGATVTNVGRIQGDGSIASPIVNAAGGRIEPTGTLAILSPLTNQVGGIVQVTPNNALILTQGFTANTNSGLITLAGGEFDTNNLPMTNGSTGQITGYGTLSTGGLRNSGSITFTGGTTIVNGPVTNDAAKSLRIQYNPAIFTGMVQNNGNLYVTSTTATFAGGYGGGAAQGSPPPGAPPVNTSGAVSGTGSTVISPGGMLVSDGIAQSAVTVQGAAGNPGQLVLLSREPAGVTPVTGRAVGQSISIIGTLSISTGAGNAFLGNIDLQDNDLVLHATPESTVRSMVASWYHGGARDGLGLGSSLAGTGSGPDALATLGEIPNTDGRGGSLFATFGGIAVTSADVLVKYTYVGDTNLDGIVDGADLSNLFAGLNGGLHGWVNGDLNYDGAVDSADVGLLMNALAHQGATFGASEGVGGAVPEPAGQSLLAGVVPMLLCRRTRRRRLI